MNDLYDQIENLVTGWENAVEAVERDFGWSPSTSSTARCAEQLREVLDRIARNAYVEVANR